MSINFGSLATTQATSNVQAYLKPWGIYPVKFAGARKETIQGKKDPSATYDILKVRFDGDDGYYEESIFYIKPGDDKRPTYTSKEGHDYEGASSYERTMTFIAQVATVLNPEGFKKMQAMSSKFKTFDDVVQAFIKITTPTIGKETNIKLVGRNRDGIVMACLPKFVAVNKNGEAFTCDNFIGDKLFFSNYEERRKKEYENATPTPINESTIEVSSSVEVSDGLDFDNLL